MSDSKASADLALAPAREEDSGRLDAYLRLQDTIFALASGAGGTGVAIAVVRISGAQAEVALQSLCPQAPVPPARQACRRRLYDSAGTLLDEALVLRFLGAQAATGEPTVELHLHGANQTVAAVLAALGRCEGLRPAVRGEFSWRALVYGKQDLLRLEGLADLLAAESEVERRRAVAGVAGALSQLCCKLQKEVFALQAQLEARLEFGEDEFGVVAKPEKTGKTKTQESEANRGTTQRGEQGEQAGQELRGQILAVAEACALLVVRSQAELRRAAAGRGVFLGAPNAGKSSLFNALAGEDRAIVTAEAGTTRDTLEARLLREGTSIALTDTAGLRATKSVAESEGVRRAGETIASTEQAGGLLLWVVDGAEVLRHGVSVPAELQPFLARLTTMTSDDSRLVVLFNKSDLFLQNTKPQEQVAIEKQLTAALEVVLPSQVLAKSFVVSAKTGAGLARFKEFLSRRLDSAQGETTDAPFLTRQRQISAVEMAVEALEAAGREEADELIAENLRHASAAFALLLGGEGTESVLDFLFAQFCIGK